MHDLIEASSPIPDTEYLKPIYGAKSATNFGTGIAEFYLDRIVMAKYLQQAQEQIRINCVEGNSLEQMIKDTKGYTAGRLFRCKESRVPKEIFKVYLDNEVVAEVEAREAQQLVQNGWNNLRHKLDAIMKL